MSKLDEIIDNYVTQKNKLIAEIKEEIKNSYFKQIFIENDFLAGLQWRQYTPYFNDGDSCEFSVRDLNFLIKGREEDEEYEEEYSFRKEKFYPQIQQIEKTFSNIPEEVMKEIFGDHSIVTVQLDGTFSIRNYDHD